MTHDPVRDDPNPTNPASPSPQEWMPIAGHRGSQGTPEWMGTPPPAPKAIRTPGNVIGAWIVLVIGLALLIWGVPGLILHFRAATGDIVGEEMPGFGNFVRASGALVGFFLTLVGLSAVLRVMRNSRD